MEIDLDDLSRLRRFFSPLLQPVRNGKTVIRHTAKAWRADGRLTIGRDFFYRPDGRPVHVFDFHTVIEGDKAEGTFNDNIAWQFADRHFDLQLEKTGIHAVHLKKFYEQSRETDTSGEKETGRLTARIHGNDVKVLTYFAAFPLDTLDIDIRRIRPIDTRVMARKGSGVIHGNIAGEHFNMIGENLPDAFVHTIPALSHLYGGYYSFDANGTTDHFGGHILMVDALWAKSALYNNVIATLNSIPNLLTLKRPGFNGEGFKIKKGVISYDFKKPVFRFKQVSVYGDSSNIFGTGHIDFATRQIEMQMRIAFMEGLSSTLKNIPLAGYILFGKEKEVSVGLRIENTLDDPKVTTSAAKDVVMAPFNIIKRTLTLPFHLFE